MMKCPFCGFGNEKQTDVCERCKAAIPHDEEKEHVDEPLRVSKKKIRSEQDYGT